MKLSPICSLILNKGRSSIHDTDHRDFTSSELNFNCHIFLVKTLPIASKTYNTGAGVTTS